MSSESSEVKAKKDPSSQPEGPWPENIRVCQWLDTARAEFKLEENILYIEQLETGTLRCYFLDSTSQKKMVKVPASAFLPKPQKLFEPPAQKTEAMIQFCELLDRLKPAPAKPLARKRLDFTETPSAEGYTKSLDELNVFEGRDEDAKREQSLAELDEAIEREEQKRISKEDASKEKEEKSESEFERFVLLQRKRLKPQKVPNEATSSKKIRHINEEHKLKINGEQPKKRSYRRAANYHKLENNLVSYRTDPKTYLDSVKESIGAFSEIPKRILRPFLNIEKLVFDTENSLELDEKLRLKLKADIEVCIDQGEKEKLEKQIATLESRIQEQKDDIDELKTEKEKISKTIKEQEAAIKPEIEAMQKLFYDEDGHRFAPELEAICKASLTSLDKATLYQIRRKLILLRKLHSDFNETKRPDFNGKALQLASFASSIENLDRLIEMVEKELSNRAWAAPAKSSEKKKDLSRSKANRFASRSENSVVANTAHKRVKIKIAQKLAALDIDGTLYTDAFEISAEAAKAALSIKGDIGTVEAFTARDKAEFKQNVVSALKNSIAAIASSDQRKSEEIIKSIDGIKTKVIKEKLKQQYKITLGKICTLRDCMPNEKGKPRVLGSYYEDTLKKFEDQCCKQFQDELLDYIKGKEFNKILLLGSGNAIQALNDKIKQIEAKIVVDEPKCTATKADLIAKRLEESKAARKSISEVFFLDDSVSHLRWVNHANWLGRFRAVPVSAVQANANSTQSVFKEHNLLAQHAAQIQAREELKREPRAFSHFDNPIYLEYKRSNIKGIFFTKIPKVPKEIINFKVGPKAETLLHYVSRMGDLECVKALMRSSEIDLYIQNSKEETFFQVTDQYGRTILHQAVANGNLEIVEMLIEAGANVNARDNNGITVLHHAVANGNPEMVARLIKAGADVNAQDNNGITALHHAVANGNMDMVDALIILGAKVDVQDNNGLTALHHAVAKDDMDMVRALIAQGADITIQDKEGNTPFDLLRPLLNIRIETLKALQDILVVIKKAIDDGIQLKISEAIKNSILATLKYTEFGRQYSTLLKADMDFWTPNIDPYTMKSRHDFCRKYIKFCIESIESTCKTSNLSMETPEISMNIPRSKRKKYQEATPQKPETNKGHSEQKLYVLQKIGITEKRETAVIPVAIISNTQGRAIPDKQAKSYYNRADIRPMIERVDTYAARPEVDFHDAPGDGIFYMPDSVYKDGETAYFFKVTEKDGFQVLDPITGRYFSPYNRADKLCARFIALREYSSVKVKQKQAEAIVTESVNIDALNESLLEKRKESISAVLNARNELARNIRSLVNELSLDIIMSLDERSNKFLVLRQLAIEFGPVHSTSLFDDIIGIKSFVTESVNIDALNEPLLKKRKESISAVLNASDESARNIRSLVNELSLDIIMSLDERSNKFLDLCQLAIEFDRVHSTALFDDIIGIMSFERDDFTRDIAIIIRSGLSYFSQDVDQRKQFIYRLQTPLINLRKDKITLEEFIVDCSKIGARSSISSEIEIERAEKKEHGELDKVLDLKDDISSDDKKAPQSSNAQENQKAEQDSPVENKIQKRPVALLDVDQTLYFWDEKQKKNVLNERLLYNLKARGILDIYLFTDMNFQLFMMKDRMDLIVQLKERGFAFHGIITPADLMWNQVKESDIEAMHQYNPRDVACKATMRERAIEAFDNEQKENGNAKDENRLGRVFRECYAQFGKSIETAALGTEHMHRDHMIEAVTNKFVEKQDLRKFTDKAMVVTSTWAGLVAEEKGAELQNRHVKGLMLDLFKENGPDWVDIDNIVVADDMIEIIDTVKERDASVKTIHVTNVRMPQYTYDAALGTLGTIEDKALQQEILNRAAADNNLERVRILINEQGADVNAVGIDGKAALHHAAAGGYLEVVKFLIEHGADATVKDKGGKTYLEVTNAQGMTLLHHAAIAGDIDLVKYLIDQGADVKAKNKNGKTALQCTNAKQLDLIAFLLQKDKRLQRQSNETLLQLCHEAAMNLEEISSDEILDGALDLLERMANDTLESKTEYQYFMEWKAVRSSAKQTEGAVQASFKALDTAMRAFYVSAHNLDLASETRNEALSAAAAHVKSVKIQANPDADVKAFVNTIKGLLSKQQTSVARNKLVGAANMIVGAAAMVFGSIGIVASFVGIPFTGGGSFFLGLPANASLFTFGLGLFAKGKADYSDAKKEEKRINTLETVSANLQKITMLADVPVEQNEVMALADGCNSEIKPHSKEKEHLVPIPVGNLDGDNGSDSDDSGSDSDEEKREWMQAHKKAVATLPEVEEDPAILPDGKKDFKLSESLYAFDFDLNAAVVKTLTAEELREAEELRKKGEPITERLQQPCA